MQVILLEKIQKLGDPGMLVNVKAGYARNFLIPQGKVKLATKANLAKLEDIKAELKAKEQAKLEAVTTKKEGIAGNVYTIFANASEEGKLFGSVSATDIAKSINDLGFKVQKNDIDIEHSIRNTGEYDINVNVGDGIVAIKLIVKNVEENSS